MGGNLELPAAGTADHVGIDTNEIVLDLVEHGARPGIGSRRNLSLLRPTDPPDRIVIGSPALRALEPGRTLFSFLGEKLPFIHEPSVHEK